MVRLERNLHKRLQEMCDCYLESHYENELKIISEKGVAGDVTGDVAEVALKYLALALLYTLEERCSRLFIGMAEGAVVSYIQNDQRTTLPSPPRDVAREIIDIVREITHLEEEDATEPLSLGIRESRINLHVVVHKEAGEEHIVLRFPAIMSE